MRSARLWLVALAGVVLLMGAVPAQTAVLAPAPAPATTAFKIGVVDVVEITAQYKWVEVANAELQSDTKGLEGRNAIEFGKVKDYQDTRDKGFTAGTADWKKANEKFMESFVAYQGWLALERAKIEVKHKDVLLDIYNHIVAAVTKAAADQKCDIVFTKAFLSPPQIDVVGATGLEDLKSRILNQRVLYPPPAAMTDLTKDVITALNAQYKTPSWYVPPAPTPTAAPTGTGIPK